MHDLLAKVLSPDGHRYVIDGFGYTRLLEERNAADAIPWVLIEARPEAENQTLVEGMERLPRELAARFEAMTGVIQLGHEVIALEPEMDDDGRPALRLRVTNRPDVLVRRVVLALPRAGLVRIADQSPVLGRAPVRDVLDSVIEQAAAKLFLAYDRAWWRTDGFPGMRAVTDLPLSKIYYFDFERRNRTDASVPGLLLASYSDGPNRDSWNSLGGGLPVPDSAPYDSPERWSAYAASIQQIRQARSLLGLLRPGMEVPEPTRSAFVDWATAWHFWKPSVHSREVMERVPQPIDAFRSMCAVRRTPGRRAGWRAPLRHQIRSSSA